MTSLLQKLNRFGASHLKLSVDGNTMRGPSMDRVLYLWLQKRGLMGRQERAFFDREIRPGMSVVDVGANVGVYSLLFSRLSGPSGQVFSFEPNPELFSCLKGNLEANSIQNVRTFPVAIGARTESLMLACDPLNSGNNALTATTTSENRLTVSVDVRRLDEILPGQKIDFVKIDVQGWEPAVLEGMAATIEANPFVKIFFEFWPKGMKSAGFDAGDFLHSLLNAGFRLHLPHAGTDVLPQDVGELARNAGYINIFATRRNNSPRF